MNDNNIITDNRSVAMRAKENPLRAIAAIAVVALCWMLSLSGADAQGLVGVAPEVRYGQSNAVGQLADFGYDTARDISRVVTALSALVAAMVVVLKLRGKKLTVTRSLKAIAVLIGVPLVVHLVGTFAINNFGGLGGGL